MPTLTEQGRVFRSWVEVEVEHASAESVLRLFKGDVECRVLDTHTILGVEVHLSDDDRHPYVTVTHLSNKQRKDLKLRSDNLTNTTKLASWLQHLKPWT